MCGKLGGALRADNMPRAATQMIAARYQAKPLLIFRMRRISDTGHSVGTAFPLSSA
jgi:hypothetical protein